MKELSQRQYRTLYAGSVLVLLTGLVGDVVTTHIGLSRFGAREVNPVASTVFSSIGIVPGLLAISTVLLAFVVGVSVAIERTNSGWVGQWGSIAPILTVAGVKLIVTYWNTTQILLAV